MPRWDTESYSIDCNKNKKSLVNLEGTPRLAVSLSGDGLVLSLTR